MESPQPEKPGVKIEKSDNDSSVATISTSEYNNLLQLIICKICFKRIDPPVKTCVHGAPLCHNCKSYNGATCNEHCRSSNNVTNDMLNKMIQIFPVNCSYTEQGCTRKMQIQNILTHEKLCDYRGVSCLVCKNPIPLIQLNDHILNDHKEQPVHKTDFFASSKLIIIPQNGDFGYYIFYVEKIQKHFIFEYHFSNETTCAVNCVNYSKERNFGFCLQYIGVEKEASNSYLYDFKIDQGLDCYYYRSDICTPYKDVSRLINFKVSGLFLTNEYESCFEISIMIKPRAILVE